MKLILRLVVLTLVLSLLATEQTFGQYKAKMKMAKAYYDSFDFLNAAIIYKDVLSEPKHAQDTTALRLVADCEQRTGQLGMAEGHLRLLAATPAVKVKDLHRLAEILKIENKYDEALLVYEMINIMDATDEEAALYLARPDFARAILKDSSIYEIELSEISSSASDFAPGFFTSGKIIFSSARGLGVGARRNYAWNQQPYLNVYVADIKEDSSLTNVNVLSSDVNTRYHEGSISYDPGSNTMYLTRNNFVKGNVKKARSGRLNLGIYSSKYSNGAWGPMVPFEHDDKEYSVGHPSVNSTGTRMYFVSDMPGGMGGTDIYYTNRINNTWSSPINAGKSVNTTGNEVFPFVSGDSTLYFSSDGWLGLGGLDMYFISTDSLATKAINMGYPANSHYDDFGAILYPNQDAGYFSSNRPGGKGDDDIYEFIIHPPDSVDVRGRVVDSQTLEPISNARVMVSSDDGRLVEVMTDINGAYLMRVPYDKIIRIEAEKKNYVSSGVDLLTKPRTTEYVAKDIELKKESIVARGHVVYDVDGSPAVGATVRVVDLKGNVVDSTEVAADGSYKIALPEDQQVILEATKADYVKLTYPVDIKKAVNRAVEKDFRLFKLEKGTVVRLDNIYYDYGKADIRPDAALELNKLVQILKDNPTMRIELSSHTDARGGDSYNLKLSDQRANSAVKYVISQGIDASRLEAKGYGETKLLNRCLNNVKCTEEEHQFNRRTEFTILDI